MTFVTINLTRLDFMTETDSLYDKMLLDYAPSGCVWASVVRNESNREKKIHQATFVIASLTTDRVHVVEVQGKDLLKYGYAGSIIGYGLKIIYG